MTKRTHRIAALVTLLGVLASCSDEAATGHWADQHESVHREAYAAHFTYSGAAGPDHWGQLSPSYSTCSEGREQSPIDLTGARPVELEDIKFAYRPSTAAIIDHGHTVQVNLQDAGTITVGGDQYRAVEFHFHGPSEHVKDGISYPLEVHLEHRNAAGRLAIIGVFIEVGAPNAALDPMLQQMPETEDSHADLTEAFNLEALLPSTRATYRYSGSLTKPPCPEMVSWFVMATPITMSAAQIATLTAAFPEPNNRPLQPLNDRRLTLDSNAG